MRVPKELLSALDEALVLGVPETAVILNCDKRTVYKDIKAGRIPATRVGAAYRIPTSWLREQVRPPGKPDRAA